MGDFKSQRAEQAQEIEKLRGHYDPTLFNDVVFEYECKMDDLEERSEQGFAIETLLPLARMYLKGFKIALDSRTRRMVEESPQGPSE